ncbi:MAG: cobalt-precorrin-5B (C(1))-methyltransferase [Methanospirillum sp.]|nr:cobalt-precorrin-5B (C(1))-methyltransferase [Methanospirillum sp.]
MQDPVSGFEYPESWIVPGMDPKTRELIEKGLAILTSDGSVRRRGFTTGTTASAAAKAAILSLAGQDITDVHVTTPSGIRVYIPVETEEGVGLCRKYPGDYPGDVTAGLLFRGEASMAEEGRKLSFGEGIGRWERSSARYKKGDPAVSIQAHDEILNAIHEAMEETGLKGISLHLTVPDGREVAKKTLNRMVGVSGGISVLGTTGFVEPWDDHLEQTACERALQAEKVVLTTGRVGMKYARLFFPDYEVILAGSRLSGIIPQITGKVIICGLPALILKFMNPVFLDETGCMTVEELMETEMFIPRMNSTITRFKEKYPDTRVVLVNRSGVIIGDSG